MAEPGLPVVRCKIGSGGHSNDWEFILSTEMLSAPWRTDSFLIMNQSPDTWKCCPLPGVLSLASAQRKLLVFQKTHGIARDDWKIGIYLAKAVARYYVW